MINTYYIADLHFNHSAMITKYGAPYRVVGDESMELEDRKKLHNEWIIDSINSVVYKKDNLWILGDIAFGHEGIKLLGDIVCGNINIVLGNHDQYPFNLYYPYCKKIVSLKRHKEFWLSHAPMHPQELRGKKNIHGHVHAATIPDDRYINVSVEALNAVPISLQQIRERV